MFDMEENALSRRGFIGGAWTSMDHGFRWVPVEAGVYSQAMMGS